jgi:hypothetical protein
MSMVVYGREALDAARCAGYADGKASGRSEGHTEGRAAERADVVAWLEWLVESTLSRGPTHQLFADALCTITQDIGKYCAHVGAAKKGGE